MVVVVVVMGRRGNHRKGAYRVGNMKGFICERIQGLRLRYSECEGHSKGHFFLAKSSQKEGSGRV